MSLPLIPRRILFGNPERTNYQISPDGAWLSWVAPAEGVLNIFVAPRAEPDNARQLTFDTRRGISSYAWTLDEVHLVYSTDTDGDENTHLYALRLADGEVRDLTPYPGVMAFLVGVSRKIRDTILVQMNDRDARFHDLCTVSLASGEIRRIAENPGFAGFIVDDWYRPQIAVAPQPSGEVVLCRNAGDAAAGVHEWQPWQVIPREDARTTHPIALSADGEILYLADSRGRDTAALCALTIATGESRVIASDPRADIGGVFLDLDSHEVLAYGVEYTHHELHVIDPRAADITWLAERGLQSPYVADRSEDDAVWIVGTYSDVAPSTYHVFDRRARTLTALPSGRPELSGFPLRPMQAHTIPSRDGLVLVSYVTLPREAGPDKPVPLVLCVHGGPEDRDHFGCDGEHQWLADRGYAVLSVNFRGSTGFGKAFLNAAEGEWGRRMDDDLTDAVAWACANLPVDPARIAISGGSYGGYATLVALTRNPDLYACGIDIVGPSNLETLVASIPPYWELERSHIARMLGDPETEEGRAQLRERSPLHRAGHIVRPLLIAQGANDPRVNKAESDQMVAALRATDIPVTYLVFPDEGHGFARPENRLSFFAEAEAFLARHLGGRCEPPDPALRARSSLVEA